MREEAGRDWPWGENNALLGGFVLAVDDVPETGRGGYRSNIAAGCCCWVGDSRYAAGGCGSGGSPCGRKLPLVIAAESRPLAMVRNVPLSPPPPKLLQNMPTGGEKRESLPPGTPGVTAAPTCCNFVNSF